MDAVQRYLAQHARGAAASLAGDPLSAREDLSAAQQLLMQERLLDGHPQLLLWAVNADLFLNYPMPALPAQARPAS